MGEWYMFRLGILSLKLKINKEQKMIEIGKINGFIHLNIACLLI